MNSKVNPNGNVTLQGLGIKLEVNPIDLYKQGIHPVAQDLLDKMIETQYYVLIEKVSPKVDRNIVDEEEAENNKRILCEEILEIAMFTKNILPLHSDSEMISLTQYQQDIVELAYYVWSYNTLYCFVLEEKFTLKGNCYEKNN